jgi:hypothetical protein
MNLNRGGVALFASEGDEAEGLNFSFPGDDRNGRFSAPTFVASRDRALVKPLEKLSRTLSADLNLLQPPSRKRALGEGRGDEDSTGVGERAKARGGEDEVSTIAAIL